MADATISAIKPLADSGLSDKEIRLLAAAWLSSTSTNLDIEKFAIIAGYPSTANARKRLSEAKSKARAQIFPPSGSSSGPTSTEHNLGKGDTSSTLNNPQRTPKTPKTPTKRKKSANGGSGDGSPSKRGKALKIDSADEAEAQLKMDESASQSSASQSEHSAKNTAGTV